MRRAVAAVTAAAVAAILIALVALGTREEPRLADSNGTDAGSFSIELAAGQRHCQDHELVPRTADRVRMTIGSYDRPMPPIELTVADSQRRPIARRTSRPPKQGIVELPLGTTTGRVHTDSVVCVAARSAPIALGGFQDRARIEWLRPGEESLLGLSGTIMHRYEQGKPGWMGGWTLVLAFLVAAATLALTVRLLLTEAARS